MLRRITILLTILCSIWSFSQEKKEIQAIRISNPPKVDGVLDDLVWQNIPPAKDFYMFQPTNQGSPPETHQTEVRMAYDDKAIYFAAYIYDNEPDKILRQFSQRDNVFVQADLFEIAINTYNDGLNEIRFQVTSAGTIGDLRVDPENFDVSYNVVWQCNTSFDEKGWYAEFKIPYNALRFPESDVQNWSINFYREVKHRNETYSWNQIDITTGLQTQYNGLVKGIENIDPPLRLNLFPFVQGSVTSEDGETTTDLAAGMDLKYGLSDSFTLDATLIPDFGQAAFDDVELNLGPFEQVFDENRQFFTEGIDLFQKGNLFFSRRVGNAPVVSAEDLSGENEEIVDEPSRVDLLNALKVSGRTRSNWGIGLFNAITQKTEAQLRDTITGNTRTVVTEPLANYNIMVVDKVFNKNSSVSLINTNVTRSGGFRDANVTGLVADISNKKNSYNYEAGIRVSQVREDGATTTGFRSNLEIRRTQGNYRFFVGNFIADDNYDPNDLGLQLRNNFNNLFWRASYETFKPTKRFNRMELSLYGSHRRLFTPSVHNFTDTGFRTFFFTPKRLAFGSNISFRSENRDFFEPRVDGRFVRFEPSLGGSVFISTDYRKKFALDATVGHRQWFDEDFDHQRRNYFLSVSPRYRFSDKFLLIFSSELFSRNNNFGYFDDDGTNVFMGLRDVKSLENTISASFNFDPYKALNLTFRNFWSTADYTAEEYYILNDDGSRSLFDYDIDAEDNVDPNTNFNIWNLDLSFRWRFAPGSEAILLYRNSIFNEDEQSTDGYTESLQTLFDQPIRHNLSLRVVYFLDVNNWRGSFKG